MKNFKKTVAMLMAIAMTFSVTACSGDTASVKDIDANAREKIKNAVVSDKRLTGELENKTIKWMANWDINPVENTGKSTPIELAAFQEKYGGKVETKLVTDWETRYDQLANAINGDEGIDFFPAGDMDAFPKGAIKSMFVPVDDYIDFNSEIWADVKQTNDALAWNGSHYVICTDVNGSNCVLIYNKKTIDDYGLDDPAELYAKGEWDWNSFMKILVEYCDPENNLNGIDGYWCEAGLSLTTGVPYIGLDNGKLKNNLRDASVERVQNFMAELYKKGCVIDKSKFNWDEQPSFIGTSNDLFYPCGMWALYKSKDQWAKTFGEDVFFVPMPKDPEADKYYVPTGLEGYVMVKGGKNPEGVAKFAECKRLTLLNEDVSAISNEQFVTDYGWSQEMIDMKNEVDKLARVNPVFDFYNAVSTKMSSILDSGEVGIRASLQGGISWAETVAGCYDAIEKMITEANSNPVVGGDGNVSMD